MKDRTNRPSGPSTLGCVLALLGVLAAGYGGAAPSGPSEASPLRPMRWAPQTETQTDPETGTGTARAGQLGPGRALQLHGLRVLRHWDARRARAYAAADPGALRRLYVPGSAAGTRDVALLARYAARGLSVRGLVPQVHDVEVTRARRGVLAVRVTERFPGVRVVGERRRPGSAATAPAAGFQVRVLTMRQGATGWQVVAVRRA